MAEDDARARLHALYEQARQRGAPRLAALVGPPGCGARQRIEAFLAAAQPPAVLRGVGVRNRAFGTFQSLLGHGLGARTTQGPVVDLAAYAEQRARLFAEVRALVAQLAGGAPPVLVVEDLDRSDGGTLELLEHLLDGPSPVLVLVTAESLEAPELTALRRAPATVVLPLRPLDEEGVRTYLSRADVVARILERTGGMPEHLEELLFATPPRVTVSELGAGARALFDAAAILDRPATLEELVAVAGVTPRRADAEELVEAGLVLRTVREGVLTLRVRARRHRDEHYGRLDPERRRALHHAAARLCEDPAPEEAARHAVLGGDSPRALELAMKASDSLAAAHGPQQAAELLLEALDASTEPPVDVSARVAELLLAAGDFTGAAPHARRVRDARPQDAGALLLHARALAGSGDTVRAREEIVRALALEGDTELGAELELELAEIEHLHGKPAESKRLAANVVRRAAERGWLPIELEAAYRMAKAAFALRELDECERIASEAHERAERGGLGLPACHLINLIGNVAWARDELDRARTLFEHAAELAQDIGAVREQALALENVGVIDHHYERFARASLAYESAFTMLARSGHTEALGRVLVNRAWLRLSVGDAAGALAVSRRVASHEPGALVLALTKEVEGHAHLQLGAFDAAEAAFAAIVDSRHGFGDVELANHARIGLALVAHEAGRAELAATRLLEVGRLSARGEARRARLRALLSEELRPARQAVEVARATGSRILEQRARIVLADRLIEAGARDRAAQELRQLADLEEQLAADVLAEDRETFADRADALAIVALAARVGEAIRPVERARGGHPALRAIVGTSAPIRELRAWIERVGPSDRLVLIRGESGVGKELVADALHATSARRDRELVKLNCAAIVETLLLSELFGHERGAFTGAHAARKGRFELADGGTLFLDEIGEISPRTQAALLRVLQEQTFERVGGTRTLRVDVRVVAATNRDLKALVREGRFREDLYYRLCGMAVHVPPLRERLDDLGPLSAHILAQLSEEAGRALHLSTAGLALLRRHAWRGNVRELENVLRSAALMSESHSLTADDLRPFIDGVEAPVGSPEPVASSLPDLFYDAVRDGQSIYELRRDMVRRCIERALEESGGNISAAADLLGMKRSRVSQLVKEHNLKKGELG